MKKLLVAAALLNTPCIFAMGPSYDEHQDLKDRVRRLESTVDRLEERLSRMEERRHDDHGHGRYTCVIRTAFETFSATAGGEMEARAEVIKKCTKKQSEMFCRDVECGR